MNSNLRRLGNSDITISPIGLGCWQFSKGNGWTTKIWPVLDDQTIQEIVAVSLHNGITWFDSAEVYGWGESERALSRALLALGKRPGDVTIATKWWPLFRKAKSIVETINIRLDALNGFPIDLYQIHQPFSLSSTKAQAHAMGELAREGKIRAVGVSNFSARRMRIAHRELQSMGFRLVANQVRYNLLDRSIECNGIMDTARELGITIIAYSPLAQGLLSGKFHDDPGLIKTRGGYRKYLPSFSEKGLRKSKPVIEALKKIAETKNASASQVALSWLIHFYGNTVVAIPGATKKEHAASNATAMSIELTKEELEQLDRVSLKFK